MPTNNPASFINPAVGLESLQDVLDCINLTNGTAWTGWQLLLLDANLNPVPLPDPANPAVPNDIMPYVMSCSTDANADNEVARSITVQFEESPGLQVDVLKSRLQLRDVRYLPVNGVLTEVINCPVGTFRMTMNQRTFQGDLPPTLDGTYQDLSGVIAGKQFYRDYVTPANDVATDRIRSLMLADPKPSDQGGTGTTPSGCAHVGIGWPAALLDITPSGLIIPDPITWTWKDNTQMAALSQLCQAINYFMPWNDMSGFEVFRPNPYQYTDADGSMILPVSDWIYRYGVESIYDGSVQLSYPNMTQVYNGIRIYSESNSSDPIESVRWNNSLDSLTSTTNYGDWLLNTIEDALIPDQTTADGRALIELQAACMPEQQIQFTAHPNPFIDIHSYIGAEYKDRNGQLILYAGSNPFEVRQMRLDVGARSQQVTGLRVISLGGSVS